MKQLFITGMFFCLTCFFSSAVYSKETFLFVAHEGYEPFNIVEEIGGISHYSGLDVEIIKAAAHQAGVNVKFITRPWPRAIHLAKKGEVDGIFNLGWKAEREAFLYYPETAIRFVRFHFFANQHYSDPINQLSDLANARVGLVREYYISDQLNSATYLNKFYSINTKQLFQQLHKNRINVAIYSRIAGFHMLNQLNEGHPNIRSYPYWEAKPYPSYLAFSQHSPKGKRAYEVFKKALKVIDENGTKQAIYQKYLTKLGIKKEKH